MENRGGLVFSTSPIKDMPIPIQSLRAKEPPLLDRLQRILALGRSRDESAIESLTETAKGENEMLAFWSAWALSRIGTPKAIHNIARLWEERGRGGHYSWVSDLLAKKGEKALPVLVEFIEAPKDLLTEWYAWETLSAMGDRGRDKLIELLKHKNPETRRSAAQTLGWMRDPQVIPSLTDALLHDTDSLVQSASAASLAQLGEPALSSLLLAVRHENQWVRKEAAEGLGEIQGSLSVQALIRALGDSEWDVISEAVYALGKLKSSRAIGPLQSLLRQKNFAWTRRRVVWSLMEIQGEKAWPIMQKYLTDPDEQKVEVYETIISKCIEEGWYSFFPEITKAMGHWNSSALKYIFDALGGIYSGDENLPFLEFVVRAGLPHLRLAAIQAIRYSRFSQKSLPTIVAALEDADDRVRHEALEILSHLLSPDVESVSLIPAVPGLERIVRNDPNQDNLREATFLLNYLQGFHP